ncbi:unnamed protein product (macronuclear) [Paramecium tetraurelia]|uniref:Protein kinase domain-containing protein n=1 Tax=Paramecium tetraurelia TaxID=5888 RepID=A0BK59_PARTE|nr:uncharacterized protein GSPATT00029556001 [Paramecium tetraurelia]CAK58926.1 unnamed protein product [Paramecium tetraurelia]|eukprot:XP_001426324.1 hypothetical protein (macronuclear) [Paramecium tetraurelia strain d4-2]
MICHKKYLIFKESFTVELRSNEVVLQNIKNQITNILKLQENSVVNWKLDKRNGRIIGFGIQIESQWEYFYMDKQNLTLLKQFLDGKVRYHNIFKLYQIIGFLGSGAFGTVFKCQSKYDGKLVACKSIKKCRKYDDKVREFSIIEDFLNEVFCMQNLKHPNMVQLKEFYIEQKHFYILMELVEGDTLRRLIKKNQLDENEKLIIVQVQFQMSQQLLSLVNYFHQEGFIYRDFKPQNVVFFQNNIGKLKLIDFGLTISINEEVCNTDQLCGTPGYMAPEVFEKNHNYNFKSDMFSLGVMIYELQTFIQIDRFSGEYLIQHPDSEELLNTNKIFKFNKEILSTIKNSTIQRLLQGMLQEDPTLRINSREAVEIFKQMNCSCDEFLTTQHRLIYLCVSKYLINYLRLDINV